MKKFFFLMAATLLTVFMSCSSSSDYETKKISRTSEEFTSGELAEYVEINYSQAELSYAEKDGAIATQYIRLKVNLERVKDDLKDKEIAARNIDFTGLLSVAVIKLVDKNGTDIVDLNIKNDELLKLKKLLTGENSYSDYFIFEGEFHNSKDARKWFSEATKFTPSLTANIVVKSSDGSQEVAGSDDDDSSDSSSYASDDDDDDDNSSASSSRSSSSSSNSEDWDALLTSYDQYVDKYISVLKKAVNGDMSAYSEYPALLEKAQEFSDKMANAEGEMSAAQWAKYMKITTKMASAAQQMQ